MSTSGSGLLQYTILSFFLLSHFFLLLYFQRKERSGTGSRKEKKGKAENRSDFSPFSLHLFVKAE
jgi:hypothetical protein